MRWGCNLKGNLNLTSGVEVLERDSEALGHGLLALTDPDTGVVVLLVGLVVAIGVTDLALEVAALVLDLLVVSIGTTESVVMKRRVDKLT
jgi:hypothetical protein